MQICNIFYDIFSISRRCIQKQNLPILDFLYLPTNNLYFHSQIIFRYSTIERFWSTPIAEGDMVWLMAAEMAGRFFSKSSNTEYPSIIRACGSNSFHLKVSQNYSRSTLLQIRWASQICSVTWLDLAMQARITAIAFGNRMICCCEIRVEQKRIE